MHCMHIDPPSTEDLAAHYLREFADMEQRTVYDRPTNEEQSE